MDEFSFRECWRNPYTRALQPPPIPTGPTRQGYTSILDIYQFSRGYVYHRARPLLLCPSWRCDWCRYWIWSSKGSFESGKWINSLT